MSNKPKYLTKYIPSEFLKLVLEGRLKMGTLDEYRHSEKSKSNRFSDIGEGSFGYSIKANGNFINQRIPMGNNDIVINTDDCSKPAYVKQYNFSALVYCATIGNYSEKHHDSFLEDNPDATAYVVYDTEKLLEAFCDLAGGLFGATSRIFSGVIKYSDTPRILDVPVEELESRIASYSQQQMIDMCFLKPEKYKGEKEFRFLIADEKISFDHGAIVLSDAKDNYIRDLFKNAIYSHGHIEKK